MVLTRRLGRADLADDGERRRKDDVGDLRPRSNAEAEETAEELRIRANADD